MISTADQHKEGRRIDRISMFVLSRRTVLLSETIHSNKQQKGKDHHRVSL